MQLNNLVLAMAALTGTALALPAPTITSGPTSISASSTPSASSSSASSTSSKAMTTPTPTSANRTWGKIVAGPAASPSPSAAHTTNNNGTAHGAAEFKHYAPPQDRCPSLCSLQAQACVVALPHDEAFCYSTYEGCSKRCGRQ